MTGLDVLVVDLLTALPEEHVAQGVAVSLADADIEVPLEVTIERGLGLRATLPRTRVSSGFDRPVGRLSFSAVRGGA